MTTKALNKQHRHLIQSGARHRKAGAAVAGAFGKGYHRWGC